MSIINFDFSCPVNTLFGRGRAAEIGTEVAKWGKKCMIVTGKGSTKKSGLLDRAIDLLKAAGVESYVYDKAIPNPTTETVNDGVKEFKANGCDVMLALGGGSIIDCTKGIAFQATNPYTFVEYSSLQYQLENAPVPFVAVPTTCGTGSEGNGTCVLTVVETNDKKAFRHNGIVAKASILDPELMTTMPPKIFASVCFDALTHNMEAYISKMATPLTDQYTLLSMQFIADCIVPIYEGSKDMDLWDKATLAAHYGGTAIFTSSSTAPHSIEHPASGLRNITHGEGLAAVTPAIFEKTIQAGAVLDKFAKISQIFGGKDANDCPDTLRKLLEKIGLNVGLKSLGILDEDIEWMADNAPKVMKKGLVMHPVDFSFDDIVEIYKMSM